MGFVMGDDPQRFVIHIKKDSKFATVMRLADSAPDWPDDVTVELRFDVELPGPIIATRMDARNLYWYMDQDTCNTLITNKAQKAVLISNGFEWAEGDVTLHVWI